MPTISVTIAPLRRERRLTTSLAHPTWASGETPADEGWYAQITTDAYTANVSKLDGETGWTVDDLFRANGYPVHVNGYANRMLRTHELDALNGVLLDTFLDAYAAVGAEPRWGGR